MTLRALFLWGVALAALAVPRVAEARRETVVIIDEAWSGASAEALQLRADALGALLARHLGWKPNSVKARAFDHVEAGLAFLAREKPGFALLSPRPFAKLHREQKIAVVAHAVDRFGTQVILQVISRSNSSAGHKLHLTPGFTLASAVDGDLQWLNVVFDGMVSPARHFSHLSVATMDDAVKAVRTKQADLALIDEAHYKEIELRFQGQHPEFKVAYSPMVLPPRALVATRKARPPDSKTLLKNAEQLCSGDDNRPLCAELRLFGFAAGPERGHPHLAYKYAHYK